MAVIETLGESLTGALDPVRVCERLAGLPYRLFLDSAVADPRLGRWSFLTADPVALVRSKGPLTEVLSGPDWLPSVRQGDVLGVVRSLLAPHAIAATGGAPPFQGGAAGYLGYEWGRVLERVPAAQHDDLEIWDAVLGIYDWVVAWDHQSSRVLLVSTGLPEEQPAARQARASSRAATVRAWLDGRSLPGNGTTSATTEAWGARRSEAAVSPSHAIAMDTADRHRLVRSSFDKEGYLAAVGRIRDYILAGDVFQANLSQRLEVAWPESAWSLYRRMRRVSPAPFAAFAELPDMTVVSVSPERFLRVDASRRVEARPIKGTRPRDPDPERDAQLARELTESAKDRAENLMIVDLMRNDLSRVCEAGTVGVPELLALESHATVHHLVSTVVGRLEGDADPADLLRAAFPGGSITGAPKIRAMEIIAELEPACRGVYCGSIGYWSVTGELDMSIAIRTAVVKDGRATFGAGGGVVADSDPSDEYLETLVKARAFIDATR